MAMTVMTIGVEKGRKAPVYRMNSLAAPELGVRTSFSIVSREYLATALVRRIYTCDFAK
jgi:hypothetical protein